MIDDTPQWDTEKIAYSDHETIRGLELDDGTYLDCFKTELVNRFGEVELFEPFGGEKQFRWWDWGPHGMLVVLQKHSIQSMFDADELRVVPDDSPYTVKVIDGANGEEWTETVEAESAEDAVMMVHNQYSGHSHTTKLVVEPEAQHE